MEKWHLKNAIWDKRNMNQSYLNKCHFKNVFNVTLVKCQFKKWQLWKMPIQKIPTLENANSKSFFIGDMPIQKVTLVKCHFNKCLLTSYSLATRHSYTIAKMPFYQVLTGRKWRRQYLTEDKRFCRWQEGKKFGLA